MDEQEVNTDLSVDEATATLVADLPEAVRNFVTGARRDEVSLGLSRKYNLHADQAGDFEHAYLSMLLGVYTPEEFAKELRDAGLPEATVQGLATDLNEQVFKRLREEERVGAPVPTASVVPPPPQVPVMGIELKQAVPPNLPGQEPLPQIYQAPLPAAVPTPIAPTPAPVYQAPILAPQPIPQYQPTPTPIYSNPLPQPAPPQAAIPSQPVAAPYQPAARTMESDMQLIEQGGYQVPQQPPVPQPTYQAPMAPPAAPVQQAVPQYQPPAPVAPQPVAHAVPPVPSYPPPAMAAVHLTPVDRAHSNAPITKEYGSDPYREPIE